MGGILASRSFWRGFLFVLAKCVLIRHLRPLDAPNHMPHRATMLVNMMNCKNSAINDLPTNEQESQMQRK
jgi:hypothetical protein